MTVVTILLVEITVSDLTKKTYFYRSGDPGQLKHAGPVFKMGNLEDYDKFLLKTIASYKEIYLVSRYVDGDKPVEVYVEKMTNNQLSKEERVTILDILDL